MAGLDGIFRTWRRHPWGWRFWFGLLGGLAIALGLQWGSYGLGPELLTRLPQSQTHPLPETLQGTSDPITAAEDYFGAVTPSPLGHLIWSEFPVNVYVAPLDPAASPAAQQRQQQWQWATIAAIAQWQTYLPLLILETADTADIVIQRQAPPAQREIDPETGKIRYSLGRNAETRYEFYIDDRNILRHRMTILLNDHQGAIATQNTACHELGHALGIWGHSPNAEDALFPRQMGTQARISAADINTLRKIYQQPTRLGWPMPPLATKKLADPQSLKEGQ
ncbi:matrixin family metalloprotease [Picosynechococcus sp. PCC 7003]|uniref:matrixin family metalloprotease n=1 Tax=Picosynechococcus sp. PCC 7003 TaxID=374981 RepID=UPI0009FCE36C|nr:matrixin family metalloprotease [Picosynechococcus sp. PCC 7003]